MVAASQLGYVQQCVSVDEAGTCTAWAAMPPPYAIPPMSGAEAAIILAVVVPAWLIGFWIKISRRALEDSE